MNPMDLESHEIEEAKRVAHFCSRISSASGSVERQAYGCATSEAEAEAFVRGAIADTWRELAGSFGVAPSSVAISVRDCSPTCFPYNPALIRIWASHRGRERWCDLQLWTREPRLDRFQERVARALAYFPVHRKERVWTKIKEHFAWHRNR
jgi:hypothetical protein